MDLDGLENTMDVKKPARKDTYCVIPFLCNVQNKQIYRDKKVGQWLLGLERMGKEGVMAERWGLFLGGNEMSWKLTVVKDTQLYECTKSPDCKSSVAM